MLRIDCLCAKLFAGQKGIVPMFIEEPPKNAKPYNPNKGNIRGALALFVILFVALIF